MDRWRRLMSFSNLNKPQPASGQVATLLMLVMVVLLVFVMATVNLGQVSVTSTNVANAADAAALNLGSQLATKAYILRTALKSGAKGGKYADEHSGSPRGPRRCQKGGFLGVILAIVFAVIAITVPAVAAMYGGTGILGPAVAGALGGAIGNTVIYGNLQGALVGAVQGFAIGASVAYGFQAAGTTAHGAASELQFLTGSAPSTFSAAGAAKGVAIAASMAMGGHAIEEQIKENAMAAAAKGLTGLPEYTRIQQSVIFDALSRTVEDPTTVLDTGIRNTAVSDPTDPLYWTVPPDLNGHGSTTDKVPKLLVWWEQHLQALHKQELIAKTPPEVEKFLNGPMTKFRNNLEDTYACGGLLGREPIEGTKGTAMKNFREMDANDCVYGRREGLLNEIGRDLSMFEYKLTPKDGSGNRHQVFLPVAERAENYNSYNYDVKRGVLVPEGRRSTNRFVFRNQVGHRLDGQGNATGDGDAYATDPNGWWLWKPPPGKEELLAWQGQDVPDNPDPNDPNNPKYQCDEDGCAAQGLPYGFDEIDGAVEVIQSYVEMLNELLNKKNRKEVLANWQEWPYLLGVSTTPGDEDKTFETLIKGDNATVHGLENWKKELDAIKQRLPSCLDDKQQLITKDGQQPSNWPCKIDTRIGPDGLPFAISNPNLNHLTQCKNLFDEKPPNDKAHDPMYPQSCGDEFIRAKVAIDNLIKDIHNFETEAVKFLTAVEKLSKDLENPCRIEPGYTPPAYCNAPNFVLGTPNPVTYDWTDSRGPHKVKVHLGHFKVPRVKKTSRGWLVKTMCLRLADFKDTYATTVTITRTDPANETKGLWTWNPFKGQIEKKARPSYSWDHVGLYDGS